MIIIHTDVTNNIFLGNYARIMQIIGLRWPLYCSITQASFFQYIFDCIARVSSLCYHHQQMMTIVSRSKPESDFW